MITVDGISLTSEQVRRAYNEYVNQEPSPAPFPPGTIIQRNFGGLSKHKFIVVGPELKRILDAHALSYPPYLDMQNRVWCILIVNGEVHCPLTRDCKVVGEK